MKKLIFDILLSAISLTLCYALWVLLFTQGKRLQMRYYDWR